MPVTTVREPQPKPTSALKDAPKSSPSVGSMIGIAAILAIIAGAANTEYCGRQHGNPIYGEEGDILRFVFPHSLALACLAGLLIYLMAYVAPFTHLVIRQTEQ